MSAPAFVGRCEGCLLLVWGSSCAAIVHWQYACFTEQNLCGEFRHMKTPQRTPHVVVIQDVVKMT